MFTGIVAAVGRIEAITLREGEGRFLFATAALTLEGVKPGDSIAVNGCCLTVVELSAAGFAADLSRETMDCTTFANRQPEDAVNFERPLALGEELGGHLVTGHIDGVGTVREYTAAGESWRLVIEAPDELAGYIAKKGSICVDGTSLTVNNVADRSFELMIVPHTQAETIISRYTIGTTVNLEVDIIARYLERMLQYTGHHNNDE